MLNGNKKVVVVLEVETNKPEFFKATRLNNHGHYAVEIDGLVFVATLMPSNSHPGYYELLNELFALKLNEEVREALAKPNLSAADLLLLMDHFQEPI
ncbi:hypothetical protein LC085_07640 [Bacillus tianshenii]|uniref:hypothetical protein n=1 Tax=Sutcliffiella tianshenii TaxID=1463404 RepID=UPI001CD55715|nr:hypothetical protein [Bacillus tianshenii]MCA1319784.1 hypothetical protein [Bacillus tianshenii]